MEEKTDQLFKVIIDAGGSLSDVARNFINSDTSIKREFLLDLKGQLITAKQNVVDYFGEDFVRELQSYH